MSLTSLLQHAYLDRYKKQMVRNSDAATVCQKPTFEGLIRRGMNTVFGIEHGFDKIQTYEQFCLKVPVRSYEAFVPYIERILNREANVLWQGLPAYFSKTSGTTGSPKYLPVTQEFIRSTQNSAKYMLANYGLQTSNTHFLDKKVLHISDPHVFENRNGFLCAAISAIKSHQIPSWAKKFSLPGDKINAIADPEQRLAETIHSIKNSDLRLAVGLPIWLVNFLCEFEKITAKKFKECFPNFQALFVTGMNYEPYQKLLRLHLGNTFHLLENYTATEANFAYQDRLDRRGMQLICNQGIFYEFILLSEANRQNPNRCFLRDVKVGEKYIMVVSTNSGLWAYRMTDIIEFVSIDPYRLMVRGRLDDIFSPFGEHMLPAEAEHAVAKACEQTGSIIKDFVVSSYFNSENRPGHKWYIEFPDNTYAVENFSAVLNETLCRCNTNYNDLIRSKAILLPLIIPVRTDFFKDLYKQEHKHCSTQTKVSRFRTGADWLYKI